MAHPLGPLAEEKTDIWIYAWHFSKKHFPGGIFLMGNNLDPCGRGVYSGPLCFSPGKGDESCRAFFPCSCGLARVPTKLLGEYFEESLLELWGCLSICCWKPAFGELGIVLPAVNMFPCSLHLKGVLCTCVFQLEEGCVSCFSSCSYSAARVLAKLPWGYLREPESELWGCPSFCHSEPAFGDLERGVCSEGDVCFASSVWLGEGMLK